MQSPWNTLILQFYSTLITLHIGIIRVRTDLYLGTALNELDRDLESLEYFDKALEIVNSNPILDRESKFAYLRNKGKHYVLE